MNLYKSENKENQICNLTFYFNRYCFDMNTVPAFTDFTGVWSHIRFLQFCQIKRHFSIFISLPFYTFIIRELGWFRPGEQNLFVICDEQFNSVAALLIHHCRIKTRENYIFPSSSWCNLWWRTFKMTKKNNNKTKNNS